MLQLGYDVRFNDGKQLPLAFYFLPEDELEELGEICSNSYYFLTQLLRMHDQTDDLDTYNIIIICFTVSFAFLVIHLITLIFFKKVGISLQTLFNLKK